MKKIYKINNKIMNKNKIKTKKSNNNSSNKIEHLL